MSEEAKPKGNAWTNFVRQWAVANNMSYMEAIKNPAVGTAYKEQKKTSRKEAKTDNFDKLKADAVALATAIDPPKEKKKVGRPSKYASEEEKKEAKRLKTLASNKKKREEERKAKKEGTQTDEQKEKWERDTEMKVEWTRERRIQDRADAIENYGRMINKVEDYIQEHKEEFLQNYKKEPYSPHHWGTETIHHGKYGQKAWDLFGDAYYTDLIRKALTPEEYTAFNKKIPLYDKDDKALENIKKMSSEIRDEMSPIYSKMYRKQQEELKQMGEADPVYPRRKALDEKKQKEEYERLAAERERKAAVERALRDKAERERRAALTKEERRKEDYAANRIKKRLEKQGRMVWGSGRSDRTYTSLRDLPFWDI